MLIMGLSRTAADAVARCGYDGLQAAAQREMRITPTTANGDLSIITFDRSRSCSMIVPPGCAPGDSGSVRLLQLFIGCSHESASSIETDDISKSPSTMRISVTADLRDICTGIRERTYTRNRNHR